MTQRMTCLQGHEWDASEPGTGDGTATVCPVCGAAGYAVTSSVSSETRPVSSTEAAPTSTAPVTGRSVGLFWVAVILVIGAGIGSFFAIPRLFPGFEWFGDSGPLKDERTVVVRPGEPQRLQWDNPRVETATVTVSSPGSPVNVFVVSEADVAAALRTLSQGNAPTPTLATKIWVENVTVEIRPGKKPFVLLLQTASPKAEVKVTVRGH